MSSDIPIVADSDRRSTATLSASVGPVTVSFPVYGGASDLSVFVDGELIAPADWTLTSASLLDPTTDVLPASDGRVTFDNVQTGDVEIIGEINPKRLSQFTPGVGIPAESHNLVLSVIIATLREVYSWGKAAIRLNPGERSVKLPGAVARADKLLSFDANGDVEATVDKTGITGPTGPTGAKGFVGRHFTFDATTSDADPGSGTFRLNNASLASVTGGFFDNLDINGASVTGWFDMFDDNNDTARRGIIEIIDISDETNFAIYLVTGSVVDGTGYRKLTLSHRASNGTLAGECTVAFYQAGDKGAGDLSAANNLSDIASPKTGFDNISVHGSDVASASTIDLDAATGVLVDVTGTTSITAITLANGRERVVRFTGILTLTNGASLVLPGGQNITTAAGDYAIFRGYSGGVVRCVGFFRKDGHSLTTLAATIASATTTDLGSNIAESITVSGTTTITGFGSTAPTGAVKAVYFSGALTLTHNGTSLIIPGAANIVTVAGDCLIARHEGSGNWRVLTYMRGAGRPVNTGAADNLAKGFTATQYDLGTVTTGTTTLDPLNSNHQKMTNNGASTLAPPSLTAGLATSIVLEITNAGSAGSLTTSGWTKKTGDSFTTTNAHKFVCYCHIGVTGSHMHVVAMQ